MRCSIVGANVYNPERKLKTELINDHFQNYKRYHIPKAQLVIADIPYNLGNNAYASSLEWYVDGDNKKGESDKANKAFFDTDNDFRISEFMHFCSKMLIKEPKDKGKAPAMIVFCAFQQMQMVIDYGKKYGFNNSYPLVFIKPSSAQVLKANMKIVGATEYAVVLYRDKLPKFNNGAQKDAEGKTIRGTGKMIKNWFEWKQDDKKVYPKIHPTQKPVNLLKQLIEIFTDEGEVVIDPCAGSASTLRAAAELNRNSFGFEIKKDMYLKANAEMLSNIPAPMVQECLTI
ncbi:site-specific DNA-methyltransferase [Culicoidibacter larvae]|uniref:Site-specific DNA-methyltransferase n=1 Tax=Culicoidibacter larvae TaxID=2579976 RepID=A0A5R8QAF5_9FIRM|nr:site-specific DNA-methyltransferase [Culicoidibacter larvae]